MALSLSVSSSSRSRLTSASRSCDLCSKMAASVEIRSTLDKATSLSLRGWGGGLKAPLEYRHYCNDDPLFCFLKLCEQFICFPRELIPENVVINGF